MYNTNWSQPNTNIFAALLNLRNALTSGRNAKLIRLNNEDCAYPIKYKEDPKKVNFRGYKFSIGFPNTYNKILSDINSPWNQYLSLNYTSVYGTPEAIEKYYTTGELSMDNLKGMGRNHLAKVDDVIELLKKQPAKNVWAHERAASLYAQYKDPATRDKQFMFDFFTPEHGNEWTIKKFKHKLWVVVLLDENEPLAKVPVLIKIFNVACSPVFTIMKWIPKKDVLNMKEYKLTTFRVGSVVNGWSVQFHTPKKFSFK